MMLFFFLPFLAVPVLSSLEQLSCYRESDFSVSLSDGRKAQVYGGEVNVFFQRDEVRVYAYPDTDEANFRINDTIIMFKGILTIDNSETPPQRIDKVVFLRTRGIGNLKKHNHKTKLNDCQVYFIGNETDSLDIPLEVKNEFQIVAQNCVDNKICTNIGTIQPEDYAISTNPDDFGPISVYAKMRKAMAYPEASPPVNSTVDETKNDKELQSLVNSIVDITLAELINKLKEQHAETIEIPDINKTFSVGSGFFETSGSFDATDGYFSDLTTLKRTNDAVISRQGSKFSASCGFGLSTARIEYNDYQLKYSLIKVSGKLSADVNGIAIDSKVSVDYNQEPCKSEFEYFKITEFGKMKVMVTGLGPLNSLASSLVTWITKKWHTDIATLIETKVSGILDKQIKNFNCEKYRP